MALLWRLTLDLNNVRTIRMHSAVEDGARILRLAFPEKVFERE